MTLDNILEKIKEANSIVILTHETPDGDAIGSALATKIALKQLGKEADVIIPEYSKCFNFLPEANEIKKISENKNYDLAISVDCADFKRLVSGEEYFETAKNTINIDHHSSNAMFANLNFVNPVSPANCEVLAGMFQYFGLDITQDVGTCLLTGIITDTGGFRYSGVTAETFEFAAELLRKGVNIPEIFKKVLDTKTKANFELTKIICDRMEFLENGKISFTYMNIEDEKKSNAETGDHEGLVEIGRDIDGVEVSIFIREKEGQNGYKVSLRSNDYVNVSDVAMRFGGGGHPKAAGCFIAGTIQEVKEKIVVELKRFI